MFLVTDFRGLLVQRASAAILRKLAFPVPDSAENAPKIEFSIFLQSSFVADVGSVLLGLSLHGLALLAALEKGHFLGSQSKFQELRSASGFKRALDPRSKISRVRPARAETCHERER